jgi:Activator of Hsp90 ATPase homolog 1-like protein
MPDGEVTEWDPPRVLAHTWGEDRLRWELRPHDDGCLLILIQIFEDRMKAARDAAGWHLCLDVLAVALDGAPVDRSAHSERPPEDWKELNRAYEERFGILPEQATPPPG